MIWEFMLKQKMCKMKGQPPSLMTYMDNGDPKEVTTQENATSLAGILQGNLQWRAQLETGENAILPLLRKKLGAMKHVAKHVPREGKLLLANGLIIGKLNYLLVLLGGTNYKHLRKIQVLCINTVRYITGANRRAKTLDLVKSVNWLTVKEMVKFYTLIAAWTIVWQDTPKLMADKFTLSEDYLLETTTPRLQNTAMGVRWRMRNKWNMLPIELRLLRTLPKFKLRTKNWIKENREHDPGDNNSNWCKGGEGGTPQPPLPTLPGYLLDHCRMIFHVIFQLFVYILTVLSSRLRLQILLLELHYLACNFKIGHLFWL